MAKLKGLLLYRLGQSQVITIAAEDAADAVLQNVDGGADVEWTNYEQLGNNPNKLMIRGTPVARRPGPDTGDLVGDLTVTIEPGTAPTDSVTISNVVYAP